MPRYSPSIPPLTNDQKEKLYNRIAEYAVREGINKYVTTAQTNTNKHLALNKS